MYNYVTIYNFVFINWCECKGRVTDRDHSSTSKQLFALCSNYISIHECARSKFVSEREDWNNLPFHSLQIDKKRET